VAVEFCEVGLMLNTDVEKVLPSQVIRRVFGNGYHYLHLGQGISPNGVYFLEAEGQKSDDY
jgi:hypothetical protein